MAGRNAARQQTATVSGQRGRGKRRRLFLRHAGVAPRGEIGGLKERAGPRYSENYRRKIIERIGMLDLARRLCANELKVECNCDPPRDLILQREQIACVAFEPLGP